MVIMNILCLFPFIDVYFSIFLNTRKVFLRDYYLCQCELNVLCNFRKDTNQSRFITLLIGSIAEYIALSLANAFIVFAMFIVTGSLQISSISESANSRLISSVVSMICPIGHAVSTLYNRH